ncbi:MAG: hypothetical protein IJZ13_05880 [Clostridia bacterium]|nr:hypothetical protein [Clostridia bacterium]
MLLAILCVVSPVSADTAVTDTRTATPLYTLPADLTLNAEAVLLVHLGTEQKDDLLIFGKNEEVLRSPAALVRLMAGIVAMDMIEE